MDALADVLQTINLSGVIFLRAELAGKYGISMPPPTVSHPTIKPLSDEHRLVMFHIVRNGAGYVEVDGFEPRALNEGDLIIIFDDLYHSLVDAPGRETIPSSKLVVGELPSVAPPAVRMGRGGQAMSIVCGMLQFVDRGFNPLFSALPPFLHIAKNAGPESAWLQGNVSHILREADSERPGHERLLGQLTELLFVETLRSYLESQSETSDGWFTGLSDPVVGKAIQLVHKTPAHPWTVAELAKRSGTSRSAFSARFTELLNIGPMAYVTRWRLRLASNFLEAPHLSVAKVAHRVGYESESAFNRAFKKEMGMPPSAWRARNTANEA